MVLAVHFNAYIVVKFYGTKLTIEKKWYQVIIIQNY